MARDALYDLQEFIDLRDPNLRSSTFPDAELQSLCRKMLASRSKRIEMAEVSHNYNQVATTHQSLNIEAIPIYMYTYLMFMWRVNMQI